MMIHSSSVNKQNCFFADHHNSPFIQAQVEGDKNGERGNFLEIEEKTYLGERHTYNNE